MSTLLLRSGRLLRGRGGELPESAFAYTLAFPALLLTLVLLAYPLAYSFWVSLHEVTFGGAGWTWVGLDNYRAVLGSPLFGPSLLRTLYFSAMVVTGTVVLGLSFALLLNEHFPGRNILRGLLILPWALSQITLALAFGWIFNSRFGPLNGLLIQLGLIDQRVAWFAEGWAALNIMAIAFVWYLVPFATLLLMGALATVPEDLMKAARVDGAGSIRRFLEVTLPWIRDTLLIVFIIATLNAFLAFALIYVLTGGGPGTETTVLAWWGYTRAFRDLNLGEGAAIFYMMTLAMLGVAAAAVFTFRLSQRRTGA